MKLNDKRIDYPKGMRGTLQEALTAARLELLTDEIITASGKKMIAQQAHIKRIKTVIHTTGGYLPTDMDALCNSCSGDDCDDCGFAREHVAKGNYNGLEEHLKSVIDKPLPLATRFRKRY